MYSKGVRIKAEMHYPKDLHNKVEQIAETEVWGHRYMLYTFRLIRWRAGHNTINGHFCDILTCAGTNCRSKADIFDGPEC